MSTYCLCDDRCAFAFPPCILRGASDMSVVRLYADHDTPGELLSATQRLTFCYAAIVNARMVPARRETLAVAIDSDTDGIYYYHTDDFDRAYACNHERLNTSPSSHEGWYEQVADTSIAPPEIENYPNRIAYRTARDLWYFQHTGRVISSDAMEACTQFHNITRNYRAR